MPRADMILDTNVFIESKNRYYAMDICPGFWEFLEDDFEAGRSMSITHVRAEILIGKDELCTWIKGTLDKSCFYDCVADSKVADQQLQVANYVMNNTAYKLHEQEEFLRDSVADSWLVAYALAYGGTIVTQEVSKSSKVSLVDVCDHFHIRHVNVYEYLRAQRALFYFRKKI